MKKLIRVLIILLACLGFSPFQDIWHIPADIKVNFSIDGLMGIAVNGTMGCGPTVIRFDPALPDSAVFSVIIPSKTLFTGNKMRDSHVQGEEYLDVTHYPDIRFISTSVVKAGDGQWIARGKLSIRNITKDIFIPFRFTPNGNAGKFTGEFKINRLDYGIGRSSMGMGDEVRIHLQIAVIRS